MVGLPLERFVKAQINSYSMALAEIKAGKKRTHWMWYIFPQLKGLGMSSTSLHYGIQGLAEAKAYLAHSLLSARLIEITSVLMTLPTNDPVEVLGGIDAKKLCSSMTLFALCSGADSVFHRVLEKYFSGVMDPVTVEMVKDDIKKD